LFTTYDLSNHETLSNAAVLLAPDHGNTPVQQDECNGGFSKASIKKSAVFCGFLCVLAPESPESIRVCHIQWIRKFSQQMKTAPADHCRGC
jgi:hypothetical protein